MEDEQDGPVMAGEQYDIDTHHLPFTGSPWGSTVKQTPLSGARDCLSCLALLGVITLAAACPVGLLVYFLVRLFS